MPEAALTVRQAWTMAPRSWQCCRRPDRRLPWTAASQKRPHAALLALAGLPHKRTNARPSAAGTRLRAQLQCRALACAAAPPRARRRARRQAANGRVVGRRLRGAAPSSWSASAAPCTGWLARRCCTSATDRVCARRAASGSPAEGAEAPPAAGEAAAHWLTRRALLLHPLAAVPRARPLQRAGHSVRLSVSQVCGPAGSGPPAAGAERPMAWTNTQNTPRRRRLCALTLRPTVSARARLAPRTSHSGAPWALLPRELSSSTRTSLLQPRWAPQTAASAAWRPAARCRRRCRPPWGRPCAPRSPCQRSGGRGGSQAARAAAAYLVGFSRSTPPALRARLEGLEGQLASSEVLGSRGGGPPWEPCCRDGRGGTACAVLNSHPVHASSQQTHDL